jgi:hypothetical protein
LNAVERAALPKARTEIVMKVKSPSLLFNSAIKLMALNAATIPAKDRPVSRMRTPIGRAVFLVLLTILSWAKLSPAQSSSQIGLPVIFVHGFCDSPDSFLPLEQSVKSFIITHNQGSYRSSTDYIAFYNGSKVEFQLPQSEVPSGQTNPPLTADQIKADDPAARFFLVALDGTSEGNYWNFNPSVVAQIPIYEKGNELAHIIWAIKDITGAPRVIVVAHSMGGLDTRAYIEGLATPTDYASTDVPYVNDIASLVTLDTPHRGACTAALSAASTTACFVNPSVDKDEMRPTGLDDLVCPPSD